MINIRDKVIIDCGYDYLTDLDAGIRVWVLPKWRQADRNFWESLFSLRFSFNWRPFFERVHFPRVFPVYRFPWTLICIDSAAWTGRTSKIIRWHWPHCFSLRIAGKQLI